MRASVSRETRRWTSLRFLLLHLCRLGHSNANSFNPASLSPSTVAYNDESSRRTLLRQRKRVHLARSVDSANNPARSRQRHLSMLQTRVVGGHAADVSDFPFFGRWFRGCGLSLVHPDIALSAAHCFTKGILKYKLELEGLGQEVLSAVDYRIHPLYNNETNIVDNNQYDFILLKLQKPIPQIRPVKLHSNEDPPLQNEEDLTIIGYGLTSEKGHASKTLQEAVVQYYDDCSFSHYLSSQIAKNTMFCASGIYNDTFARDTCQGDSGGPILRKIPQGWMQVGVTSWGSGCAERYSPGVYSRVDAAYDWMQEQFCSMSQVPPPSCISNDNTTTMSGGTELDINDQSVTAPTNDSTNTTKSYSLLVDVQYDSFPQEISWALASVPLEDSDKLQATLLHVSPRQPIAVANQLLSQEILDVTPGHYRLEVYDTIAGDGIQLASNGGDAIQLHQVVTTKVHRWDYSTNSLVTVKTGSTSNLLWGHKGNFGEFARANVEVG